MKTSEYYCEEIRQEIESLPVDFRMDYLRSVFVPLLEDAGYDFARTSASATTAALFVLIADFDRRLGAICGNGACHSRAA